MTRRVCQPAFTYGDLVRMHRRRTTLLIVQCVVQGLQYIVRPDRPYGAPQYDLLHPLGLPGWQAAGAVLIALAAGVCLTEWPPAHFPVWFRAVTFALLGLYLAVLIVASLLNSLYVAATLILPTGLILSELDAINLVRWRRTQGSPDPQKGS